MQTSPSFSITISVTPPAAWRHTDWGRLGDETGYAMGAVTNCDSNIKNKALFQTPFYGCPEPPVGRRRTCGSHGDFYCKAWGCETLTDGDPEWVKGQTWGICPYVAGRDPGTFFTVKRLPTRGRPLLRGAAGRLPPRPPSPTAGLAATRSPDLKGTGPPPRTTETPASEEKPRPPLRSPPPLVGRPHHQGESALSLLEQVFPYFNYTMPNITKSCWLCLSPRPPFYVGLGVNSSAGGNNTPITMQLPQGKRQVQGLEQCEFEGTITLAEFHGQGTCYLLANFTLNDSNYADYCLNLVYIPKTPGTLTVTRAPEGLWFICTQGIFKCLVPTNPELCVSAYIIPQVYLYGGDPNFVLRPPSRVKRTPLLIPIAATIGIIGSAAVGAGALIHGENSLRQLSQTFSKDVSLLQEQVMFLERQVDSLAEVALQNRRGLDLVFLQQGGLCAALGEECCFYANHSGVIRESIKMLTKRLKEREQEEETSSWYASLFKASPWLTTLISALAGPILILLLALTAGPWILNKIFAFIRDRIDAIKLMVLSQP
ncbi:endogenous retrovirus group S71 member 1 Env polyprotein-like [Artibeus jamaicensis]|uniref:endogenous retrovirus group S71 member 1 Env polyprotein-like n=1 Tax=Artibeus jamaicensis TaxID=9417 RepID=UPI00235AB6FD|nr:endogenous retrovirus group S71 member 1 Env polyprotein-like [Artibeus jamaicensis]